ncbi:hypothetical protein [Olleya sp. YS]|uniref:hypothetical protein n=1 Tax=Olleya sp. YS TaxID=3028318 RepID=UPI0024342840|nr:hypothetical protein [Olleya sp. YS]WGD34676.1 hypothetical protein Ollyesu_12905 [Olleya sp. YS]
MEQNNIEDLIKKRIRGRSITPTPEAKTRLISALNTRSKKKSSYWIRYLVAASVVFVLFFTAAKLVMKNNKDNQLKQITNQKKPLESHQNNKSAPHNNLVVSDKILNKNSRDIKANTVKTKVTINKSVADKKDINKSIEYSQKINPSQVIKNKEISKNKIVVTNISAVKEKTKQDIVDNQYRYISPKDLLTEADTLTRPELININAKTTKTYTNANQLLIDAERQLFEERNKSFLTKAGRKIKKFKDAVVSRNHKY